MGEDGIQRHCLCLEQESRPALLRDGRNGSECDDRQQTTNLLYLGQEVEKIGVDSCDGLYGGEGSCCYWDGVLVYLQPVSFYSFLYKLTKFFPF